tara:strand:- start:19 stop:1092 length:1074 start_codon:yes stop_codon:yes gene_type:complete
MKKILPLQSLRAICVLLVMLVHFSPYEGAFFQNHFLAGSAVITFLVLSGFIISMIYQTKIVGVDDLVLFFKKRFLRMYPLHVLFLFIFLILEFVRLYIENNYSFDVNNKAFTINNISSFFSHLLLINIFNNVLTFNAPAWTVSAEFLTSIFFGITCFFLKKDSIKNYFFVLIIILIFLTFIFFKKNFIQYTLFFGLLSVTYSFIIGFFCFKIFNQQGSPFTFLSDNRIQLLNLIILTICIYFKILDFILPFCSGLIIIYLCKIKKNNIFEKFFSNTFLIYTGKISYTLYISHYFVYWIYTQIFRHILNFEKLNSFDNSLFIEDSFMLYLSKLILSFITTYLISHFLYNKFEKKFIKG